MGLHQAVTDRLVGSGAVHKGARIEMGAAFEIWVGTSVNNARSHEIVHHMVYVEGQAFGCVWARDGLVTDLEISPALSMCFVRALSFLPAATRLLHIDGSYALWAPPRGIVPLAKGPVASLGDISHEFTDEPLDIRIEDEVEVVEVGSDVDHLSTVVLGEAIRRPREKSGMVRVHEKVDGGLPSLLSRFLKA